MLVTPQVLTLNLLTDAGKVDETDYSADFDNLFSGWMILIIFSGMEKYLIIC